MPAITNGAELVRKLRDGGTGATKVEACRRVLADVSAREGRVATADEVVRGLTAHLYGPGVTPEDVDRGATRDGRVLPPHLTLTRLRHLAATGEWPTAAATAAAPIEDILAGDAAGGDGKTEAKVEAKAADEKKAEDGAGDKKPDDKGKPPARK